MLPENGPNVLASRWIHAIVAPTPPIETFNLINVRSFLMFTPVAKRSRVMEPQNLDEDMYLRYWQLNEAVWPEVRHLSVSTDGYRNACKDVNYFAFAGMIEGAVRVGWGMKVPYRGVLI